MDGNGLSPAEMGLTTEDLGIKPDTKKLPTTEPLRKTEVPDTLEEAHKRILRIDDPKVDQLHDQWLEPRGAIMFRYESDYGHRVSLIGTVHQYNPENPMIQDIKGQVENYLSLPLKERLLVMVEGFHGGTIPNWNSFEEAVEASGEAGGAAFLAKQAGVEVVSPEIPAGQIVTRLKELGFTPDKITLADIMKTLPNFMRQGKFDAQNLASVIYGASIQAQTGWVEAIPPEQIRAMEQDPVLVQQKTKEVLDSSLPHINQTMKNAVTEWFRRQDFGRKEEIRNAELSESLSPHEYTRLKVFKKLLELGETVDEGGNVEMFQITESGVTSLFDQDMLNHLVAPGVKDPDTVFRQMSRLNLEMRDDYILDQVDQARKNDKNPLIIYGGTHALKLDPALEHLYSRHDRETLGVVVVDFDNATFDQEKFTTLIRAVNKVKGYVTAKNFPTEEIEPLTNTILQNMDVLKASLLSDRTTEGAWLQLQELSKMQYLSTDIHKQADAIMGAFTKRYLSVMETTPDILHNPNFNLKATAQALQRLSNSDQESERNTVLNVLNGEIQSWGLDPNTILKAWTEGHSTDRGLRGLAGILENLPAAIYLESQKPGILKTLSEEFGVKNFGRYPAELLIAQYDEKDNTDKPYGVVLYPYSDWNGAFFQNKNPLREFYADVKDKYSIRVLEAGSKYDIARGLLNLKRRYGAQHKISFAVIGGHGTKNSILFGGEDERHTLMSQDLQGKGVRKTSEFFEPQPNIVLVSCSTGTNEGIGQQLSEMMGAKVTAPEIPTNIKTLRATIDQNGKLLFDVKYQDEGTEKSYLAGAPQQ